MATRLRRARDDDFEEMLRADERAFSFTTTAEEAEVIRGLLDLDRFRIVADGGRIVGIAGSFALELTVPGPVQIPTGGVTWVSVAPTHRRRGILRRLMAAIHDDIDAHDEIAAALIASEGGIYERFGYGSACRWRSTRLDRRFARFDDRYVPSLEDIRFVDPRAELDDLTKRFERYRRGRVGEVSQTAEFLDAWLLEEGKGLRAALHPDGYAVWKVTPNWADGLPAHEVDLRALVAATPEAHAALWHTLLSLDLVGPITSYSAVTVDDPLPYLLTNARAVVTTGIQDRLWVRPQQVGPFLAARTYDVEDSLVLDVDVGSAQPERWRISGSPEGATAERVRTKPDLVLDRATVGALGMGGVRATDLARGRRLTGRSAEVLARADRFFTVSPLPHLITSF